jgi:hypothetical protein
MRGLNPGFEGVPHPFRICRLHAGGFLYFLNLLSVATNMRGGIFCRISHFPPDAFSGDR